uniref:Uncharacterized protein n=1 Tax=Lepeophtheirus salmonis TaxID=72036 RepID=A0A0K2UI58_LEPSM
MDDKIDGKLDEKIEDEIEPSTSDSNYPYEIFKRRMEGLSAMEKRSAKAFFEWKVPEKFIWPIKGENFVDANLRRKRNSRNLSLVRDRNRRLNKTGESKSSHQKIKIYKHGFKRSRESEETINPQLEENIQFQSEYRDQESEETKNQRLEEDILYLESSGHDSDETQICQIFVKGHL